jgi:outer membrane protein OmpA-like peptidoglycan-associated protein
MSCFTLQLFAQIDTGKKPATLVFHVFYDDFKTAYLIHTTSLLHVLSNNLWSNISSTQMGFGVNYLKGINPKIDFAATLDGSYTDYPGPNNTYNGSSEFLLDAGAGVNIKLFDDHHPVVPYLSAGLGFETYKGSGGFYVPVGAGLQFNIFNEAFVFTNMQYKRGLTSFVTNYIQYGIGVGVGLGKKKKIQTPVIPASPVKTEIQVKVAEPVVVVAPVVKLPVKDLVISVTDELTGLPLPGAEILVEGPNIKLNGTTDANGRIVFNTIQAADYTISGTLHGVNATAQRISKNSFDIQDAGIKINIQHNDPRFTLAGRVTDKNTGKPESEVTVNVVNTTQNSSVNAPDKPDDGTFNIQLEAGSDFSISGKKAGYISNIEKVSTKGLTRSTTLYVNLELAIEQALPDKAISLSNIYYDTGSAKIRANASSDLEKLVRFLNDNPGLKIEIASHTDSRGSKAVNLKLSQARAQEMVNYLQKNGISKSRLIPKGYGATRLVNGCRAGVKCTQAQHEQNRRTEFKVMGN